MKYNIGDDDYPEYAQHSTFSMPTGGRSKTIILCRRTHQNSRDLTGWVMEYVGDDPDSDWTLYKPGYRVSYPWDYNPETSDTNFPDASNDATDMTWSEPSAAIRRLMNEQCVLLIDDERIVRTIERYRS